MSQVRTGTVDVTNGSQVVTGSGTNWLTSTKINDLFIIQGESVIYRIASVASDTQISLSSNYVGTTAAGVAYVIHVDFTLSGIPLMQDGDIETVSIYNLAVVALEQGLSSGTYYLGAFTTAPTSTGTGGAITQGMMYFDTSLDLLRVYDGSAWYDGAASANAAAQSAAEAAADAVQTGLDRVQTGLDRVQTVSDAAQTISDAAQTAADRVQTGLDRAQTVSDAAQTVLDAAATAADRVQTGLDATATAADRVDVNGVETRVLAIEVSINNTFDTFDDRFLGTFAVDPTHDNDGNPISVGAVYYNSVELATKFYNGSSWDDPSQSASTSATNALNSENAAAASALDASTSASEALASEGAASTSESNAASSAADALASFNEFVDIYHGALSSAPTTNLDAGDLYFDIPTSAMRVYDGALWRAVTTVVEGVYAVAEYTNIATQTTITTAYDVGLVQVLYNGVQLNLGDFTATNSTSIVLAVAVASATDVITVIRWGAVTTSTFLGTAATADVQTSSTDTTTNALMAVGAFGLGTDLAPIVTSQDCNLITISGDYYGSSGNTANMPVSSTSFQITHSVGQTSDFATQTAIAYGAGVGTNVNKVYLRHKDSGVWESWNEIITADASGNVGIGTNSPANTLSIKGTTNELDIETSATGVTLESIDRASFSKQSDMSFYARYGNYKFFSGAYTEKMRLDSSGHLLVGKTAVSLGAVGVEVKPYGEVRATASSAAALQLNRLGTDGEIIDFRRSGVTVGSWLTRAALVSTIILDPRAGGVGLSGGGPHLYPTNNAGDISDGAIGLGRSTSRFADLFLSGGVYLGGTGAANKLDDYEEGSFTPFFSKNGGTIDFGTSYSLSMGRYTKVGNLVTYIIDITGTAINTTAGGFLSISGMPFTSSNDHSFPVATSRNTTAITCDSTKEPRFWVNNGTTYIYIQFDTPNTGASDTSTSAWDNSGRVNITGHYFTNS